MCRGLLRSSHRRYLCAAFENRQLRQLYPPLSLQCRHTRLHIAGQALSLAPASHRHTKNGIQPRMLSTNTRKIKQKHRNNIIEQTRHTGRIPTKWTSKYNTLECRISATSTTRSPSDTRSPEENVRRCCHARVHANQHAENTTPSRTVSFWSAPLYSTGSIYAVSMCRSHLNSLLAALKFHSQHIKKNAWAGSTKPRRSFAPVLPIASPSLPKTPNTHGKGLENMHKTGPRYSVSIALRHVCISKLSWSSGLCYLNRSALSSDSLLDRLSDASTLSSSAEISSSRSRTCKRKSPGRQARQDSVSAC